MRFNVAVLKLAAAAAFLFNSTDAQAATPEPRVERVVMLMRHGIRPPTKAQPIPKEFSPFEWPRWTVEPGLLTKRGAQGIALLARSDRSRFINQGLLPDAGCPGEGRVVVRASNKPRAIETAEIWTEALAPGCPIAVQHPGDGGPDPLFHGLDGGPEAFDARRAYTQELNELPGGGLGAEATRLNAEIRRLEEILGCAPPNCDLEHPPTRLVEQAGERPRLEGPLDIASTAAQSLLLEYVEGMPMSDVGWGRASREDIERLLVFHPLKFRYNNRTPYIARAAAGGLARMIVEALREPDGATVTVLTGHDTNLADLGGLLEIHWRAASYPADDVPPGGALGFELVDNGDGAKFVRAFFRSQTMDQLRNLTPLDGVQQPYRSYLHIPGCGNAAKPFSCRLQTFADLVSNRLEEAP